MKAEIKTTILAVASLGSSLYLFGIAYFEYLIVTKGSLELFRDHYSFADMVLAMIFGTSLAVLGFHKLRNLMRGQRPLTVVESAMMQFGLVLDGFLEGGMNLKAALDITGEILERAKGGGIR